jgi:RpiR family carbohydrate utilization transcriptional regulator
MGYHYGMTDSIRSGAPSALHSIRREREKLPSIQRRIADFVLGHPVEVVRMSISQLAMKTGARSESSIVRFYRTFGFTGYQDFKVGLATELAGQALIYHAKEDITIEDDVETIKRKIFAGAIEIIQENISRMQVGVLEQAVELLGESKRIILLGFASSASIAYDAQFMFSVLGLNCIFTSDPHVNAVVLSAARQGDVVLCISHSGESKDVVVPAQNGRPWAKIIAITGHSDSSLAKIADVCIVTFSEEMSYRTDAMASRIVQLGIIDILFTSLAVRMGPQGLDRLNKARHSVSYLKY